VALKDAIPAYNCSTDEEWDGWETRELSFLCPIATEGPDSYTTVFELDSSIPECMNVLIMRE